MASHVTFSIYAFFHRIGAHAVSVIRDSLFGYRYWQWGRKRGDHSSAVEGSRRGGNVGLICMRPVASCYQGRAETPVITRVGEG